MSFLINPDTCKYFASGSLKQIFKKNFFRSKQRVKIYARLRARNRECESCSNKCKQVQGEMGQLKGKHEETLGRLSALELENKQLKQKLASKDRKSLSQNKMKAQTQQVEKQQVQLKLKSAETEVRGLSKKVMDLENSFFQYKEKIKNKVMKRKEVSKKIGRLEDSHQNVNQEVEDLKKKNAMLFDDNSKCNDRLKDLKENFSKLQEKMRGCMKNSTLHRENELSSFQHEKNSVSKHKKHSSSQHEKLSSFQHEEHHEKLESKEGHSYQSEFQIENQDELKILTMKFEKCTRSNQNKIAQLIKLQSELSSLKDHFTRVQIEVTHHLTITNSTKGNNDIVDKEVNSNLKRVDNFQEVTRPIILSKSARNFLEIVDIVKDKIEMSHRNESNFLDFMKVNFTNMLKEQSSSYNSIMSELNTVKGQNTKLKEELKEINSKKISRERYYSCVNDIAQEKKKYKNIYKLVNKVKEKIKTLKTSEMFEIQKEFKACKAENSIAKQKERSMQKKAKEQKQLTDSLSQDVALFLTNFEKLLHNYFGIKSDFQHAKDAKNYELSRLKTDLGNVHKGVRRLYDEFSSKIKTEQVRVTKISERFKQLKTECGANENLRGSLETALSVSEKYKSQLERDQTHLYRCHGQHYRDKKVLKSVASFYTYLLQKLATLSAGIHHLKVIGGKLR